MSVNENFKLGIKEVKLKDRELQILFLIANGKTNSDIAMILFLSPNTIKAEVACILRKLRAHNRAQAVYLVTENGYFRNNMLLFESFVNEI